ncbi:hypothetical protein [Chromatium okenii]|uniref:hypothetical protein n=1 Tax=Chromatium okenii TaxID=61644 RepID=UPI003D6BEA5A
MRTLDGATWLCRGELALVPASEVRIPGRHNLANTLAALALLTACAPDADLAPAVDVLRQFPGCRTAANWSLNSITCAGLTIPKARIRAQRLRRWKVW